MTTSAFDSVRRWGAQYADLVVSLGASARPIGPATLNSLDEGKRLAAEMRDLAVRVTAALPAGDAAFDQALGEAAAAHKRAADLWLQLRGPGTIEAADLVQLAASEMTAATVAYDVAIARMRDLGFVFPATA